MAPKEQLFKPEYSSELLRIAASDIETAKLLFGTGRARSETVVFHVQQGIEKSLKGVTCALGKPILMVHDIGTLLGRLPEGVMPPHGYDLIRFNDYAGILRYEEGRAILSADDIIAAIGVGEDVLEWGKQLVAKG